MGSIYKRTRLYKGQRVRDRKWTIRYRLGDGTWRTEVTFTDKAASRALLTKREQAVRQRKDEELGLADPFADHRATPLPRHVDAFAESLAAAGASDKYVKKVCYRLRYAFEQMGIGFPDEWETEGVDRLILHLRGRNRAQRTINHYIDALRQFSRWGVKRRRWPSDKVGDEIRKGRCDDDIRRERRPLSPEELRRLVAAAKTRALDGYLQSHPDAIPAVREQLRYQGEGRAVAYQLAALARLRYAEIKTLLWGDLDFDRAPARITVRAKNAKSRREDTIPMPEALAGELRAWRNRTAETMGRMPEADDPVVHVGSRFRDSFRKDCEAAGIEIVDAMGRFVDMHALRHTYATWPAEAGVHPRVAQRLLRHTDIRLTMAIYTHQDESAQARAVEALPNVSGRGVGSTFGTVFGSTPSACERMAVHKLAQPAKDGGPE